MEGITVASGVDKLITTLGISGTLIVMGVIAFFVIREVKKSNEAIEKKLDELKAHSDAKDKELSEKLEKAEKDIKFLEKDTVTKEMLYRETEGWRSEMQLVRAEISKLPLEILKLTKDGKNEK